ncbi:MAG: hypothetical protein KKA84_11445 [Bacteroidetes bacterium]|nr:hypothetical protein [Bacteroidota bacterium]
MPSIKKYLAGFAIIISIFITINNCQSDVPETSKSEVNLNHLDHLYEDVFFMGDTVGIVHIYCEYPDYKWVDDSDEGIACIDDVARGAVVYLKDYELSNSQSSLKKAKRLLSFISKMQAENGWYYNFVFPDLSINETHQNSVAQPGWWSWRAIWALLNGYKIFNSIDAPYALELKNQLDSTMPLIKEYLPKTELLKTVEGIQVPTWLPYESASDQAALIVICLTEYMQLFDDTSLIPYANKLADGIVAMQVGSETEFPHGAFLCFDNLWHGWGSSQSYSLLIAGGYLNNPKYINAALFEIDNFHRYLIENKFLQEFSIEKTESGYNTLYEKEYPQIAYQLRTMLYASTEAYKVTGDSKYLKFSEEILKWFSGKNSANTPMYDPLTGRCFDGIQNEGYVNKNSGAESTIEALLAILQLEIAQK